MCRMNVVFITLVVQALTIVTHILKSGGKFIAKVFRGKDTSLLYCQVCAVPAILEIVHKVVVFICESQLPLLILL